MDYQYWVIRFVPNLTRGEFHNIGIVAGHDGGDWAAQFDIQLGRAAVGFSGDLRDLRSWIRWFERQISARPDALFDVGGIPATAWIESLRSRQGSSIQLSAPTLVDVETAQEAVDLLFPHLVERESTRHRSSVTRRTMRADVQDTFTHQFGMVLDRDFYMTPRVAIAKQHGLFDVATIGGGLALANVWAFNVMSLDTLQRDVYSWNFIVSRVREDGAEVAFGTRTRRIARSDVPIRVIIDPPQVNSGQRGEIYEAALEQWERSKVEIRTLKEFRKEPDQLLPAR